MKNDKKNKKLPTLIFSFLGLFFLSASVSAIVTYTIVSSQNSTTSAPSTNVESYLSSVEFNAFTSTGEFYHLTTSEFPLTNISFANGNSLTFDKISLNFDDPSLEGMAPNTPFTLKAISKFTMEKQEIVSTCSINVTSFDNVTFGNKVIEIKNVRISFSNLIKTPSDDTKYSCDSSIRLLVTI